MLLLAAALLSLTPPSADFDGDGKVEVLRVVDERLQVPPLTDVWCQDGLCEIEVLDVAADRPGRELVVCEVGPRDYRACELLTLRAGTWSKVVFPAQVGRPSRLTSTGNGIVLGWFEDRWYDRLEKFTWKDGRVTHVRQPLLSVVTERRPDGLTFTVDRVFPVFDQPGGATVVANVATGRPATVLLESAEKLYAAGADDSKRWFLVRTQSGLVGWATLGAIVAASDELMARAAAG